MEEFDTSPSSFTSEGLSEAYYRELVEEYHWARRRHGSSAEAIADELFEHLVRDDRSVDFSQLRSASAQTADIEDSLEKLDNLVHVLRRGGSDSIRCVEIEETPIPISADEELIYRLGRAESTNGPFEVNINDALRGVRRHLARFLVDRLASKFFAVRGITGGMSNTPNLLSVQVSSHSVGARVSYAPAYFINYLPLAAPTSPVQGFILPGRYIFRLTTPGPRYLIDQQVFDIPPTFNISLMI